jgi:DNA-binding GntR family transcriptional regulator
MTANFPQRVPRPETLTELAYQQLRTAVIEGELDSGQTVSVVSLAAKMGMSRSPVRAAVERLVSESLMRLEAGGVVIPAPGRHDLLDALAVRAPLEGLAALLAAPQLDAEDLKALEVTHEQFRLAVDGGDTRGAGKADLAFHQAIQSRCGNECLVEHLNRVQARVILATYSTAWSSNQRQAVLEHSRILSALQEQNGEAAQKAAILHLNNLAGRIRLEWKHRDAEATTTTGMAAGRVASGTRR